MAFDFPGKYGYSIINKSFVANVSNSLLPIFKYQINYRTKYLSRDELFDLFLYMHNAINKIYYQHKLIDKRCYDRATRYNNLLQKYSPKFDKALLEDDIVVRNKYFEKIGDSFREELKR